MDTTIVISKEVKGGFTGLIIKDGSMTLRIDSEDIRYKEATKVIEKLRNIYK